MARLRSSSWLPGHVRNIDSGNNITESVVYLRHGRQRKKPILPITDCGLGERQLMVAVQPERLEDVSSPRRHEVRSPGQVVLEVRLDRTAITIVSGSSGSVLRGSHEQSVVGLLLLELVGCEC